MKSQQPPPSIQTQPAEDELEAQIVQKFQLQDQALANLDKKLNKVIQSQEKFGQQFASPQGLSSLQEFTIKNFEQTRQEMDKLMLKQIEGQKLSGNEKRQLESIFELLSFKPNREDIETKVDKQELVDIRRKLQRRINELSLLMKQKQEEAAVINPTLNKQNQECLACGNRFTHQDLGNARDTQVWNYMPRSQLKFGSGFSKVLATMKHLNLDGKFAYTSDAPFGQVRTANSRSFGSDNQITDRAYLKFVKEQQRAKAQHDANL